MAFTIPDNDEAFNTNQSIWMQTDINALVAGLAGDGVVTGCAVSEDAGGASMDLDVSAGEVVISRTSVAVTGGASAVTIGTADTTNPRIDLITVDNSGAVSVTAGTAAANPKAPDIPAGELLLAMVYVPANDTVITDNQITDKRINSSLRQVTLHQEALASPGRFDASSLSQNYTHLYMLAMLRSSVSATEDSTRLYFNNDTTDANYRIIRMYGDTTTTIAAGAADVPYVGQIVGASGTAAYFALFQATIPMYTDTTYSKIAEWRMVYRTGATEQRVAFGYVSWESTAAINRIIFQPDGYSTDNFVADSFIQIVGVR